jgi:hypothetical protein
MKKDFMSFNISHWTSGKNSSSIFCTVEPDQDRAQFVVEYQIRQYYECKDFKKAMKLFKKLERYGFDFDFLLKAEIKK